MAYFQKIMMSGPLENPIHKCLRFALLCKWCDDDRRRMPNIHLLPIFILNVQRFEKISLFSSEFMIHSIWAVRVQWFLDTFVTILIFKNNQRLNRVLNKTATKWKITLNFMWFMRSSCGNSNNRKINAHSNSESERKKTKRSLNHKEVFFFSNRKSSCFESYEKIKK